MTQPSPFIQALLAKPAAAAEPIHTLGNGGFLLGPTPPGTIFTREQLDEECLEIGKMVRQFVDTRLVPNMAALEAKAEEDGMPLMIKLVKETGELGFPGIDIPEEYGGLEMGFTTMVHMIENLSISASFNVSLLAHCGIGTLPILFFGSHEQKMKYLPQLATAEMISCYALTEANSGSDALSGKTKAVLEGDHYILNGSKQWISNGSWADLAVVFARIDDQYSALIVEMNQPGVTRGAEEKKMGLHGSSTTSLTFENVKVPKENLLGKVGDAANIALNILNMGRLELGAGAIGGAKYVFASTLEYMRQRKQFCRPIVDFDMQRARLAEMAADIFALDSVMYRIVDAIDKKVEALEKGPDYYKNVVKVIRSFAMEASIAKVAGSEIVYDLATKAVKMHGGYGYSEEYQVERGLRDSVINMIFEGTNDINRLVIFDFVVRNIYSQGIPFRAFMEEIDHSLRKRRFMYSGDQDWLVEEKSHIYAGKYILCYLLNEAIIHHGKNIRNNQQLMENISNMIIQLYMADSSVARAHYILDNKISYASIAEKTAKLVEAQAMDNLRNLAWQSFFEIYDGKKRPASHDNLHWLCELTHGAVNVMRMKREVSQAIVDGEVKLSTVR